MFIVEDIGHMGWGGTLGYFATEELALEFMKKEVEKEVAKAKENETWAGDEIDDNGEVKKLTDEDRKKSKFMGNVLYEAIVGVWYKTTYEYEEYDVEGTLYRLKVQTLQDTDNT